MKTFHLAHEFIQTSFAQSFCAITPDSIVECERLDINKLNMLVKAHDILNFSTQRNPHPIAY